MPFTMEATVWKRGGIKHVYSISSTLMNSPRVVKEGGGIQRNEILTLADIKRIYPGIVTDEEYVNKSVKAKATPVVTVLTMDTYKVNIVKYLRDNGVEATMRETKEELLEKVKKKC